MRRLALLLALVIAGSASAQFGETITVARVLIDVRVTDLSGEPVLGLEAGDFTVRLGGEGAVVDSVEWIGDDSAVEAPAVEPAENSPASTLPRSSSDRPRGRIFVIFIQTDFARNHARVKGQMNFRRYLEDLVTALAPEDRIAVLSFDSHLKFRSDLTTDREATVQAIRDSIRIDDPPPPPIVPSPSLARRLDPKALKRTASSEVALLHIANALAPIQGPKTLLLVGWGLGERSGSVVNMKGQWRAARQALDAARASIFALDTTYADYHDLEIGLRSAAKQTGGFYAKTHTFAQGAIDRLRRTLSGHYELTLRTHGTLRPGTHEVTLRVDRRGATVLAPTSVIIRP